MTEKITCCGCENGPQCNAMAGYTRCMSTAGHVGAHRSYGYVHFKEYWFSWSDLMEVKQRDLVDTR